MNVHRRDRARLRQCASPPDHRVQSQPTSSSHDHHEHLQSDLQYREPVRPKSPQDRQATMIGASTNSPPSYISTIIMESRNKVFISMPADATVRETSESGDEEERRKRRRIDDQPPAVALPFFVQLSPASCEREGGAKVPKVVPSPSPLHLAVGPQEVDLELRLGTG